MWDGFQNRLTFSTEVDFVRPWTKKEFLAVSPSPGNWRFVPCTETLLGIVNQVSEPRKQPLEVRIRRWDESVPQYLVRIR